MTRSLPSPYRYALGADIGGTNLRAAIVRSDGRIMAWMGKNREHNLLNTHEVLTSLNLLFEELAAVAQDSAFQLKGIGIAHGTMVNRDGRISSATHPELLTDHKLDLGPFFPRFEGLPMAMDNDAKAAAWGEYRFGAGAGAGNLICLTVGTGIGGGIIIDGRLYHGAEGYAGHLGFQSVDMDGSGIVPGYVEGRASGTAIRNLAVERLQQERAGLLFDLAHGSLDQVTCDLVFQAARAGDALALAVIDEACTALGVAICSYLHILNPERVIIGGGVAEQGDFFFAPVRSTVAKYALHRYSSTPIIPAKLGNSAGVVGAAALILG